MAKEDLRPFKKGDPDGRASAAGKKSKRGRSLKKIIDDIMAIPAEKLINMSPDDKKALPKELQKMDAEEMMVYRAVLDAMNGDKDARRYVSEYKHGKVKEQVEHSGPDGGAIETVALDPKKYAKVRKDMLKDDDC